MRILRVKRLSELLTLGQMCEEHASIEQSVGYEAMHDKLTVLENVETAKRLWPDVDLSDCDFVELDYEWFDKNKEAMGKWWDEQNDGTGEE